MKRIGAALLPACACLLSGMPAGAQEKMSAGDMLSDICPSHADYIWEIKSQAP